MQLYKCSVTLDDTEAVALARTKGVHVLVITVTVVGGTSTGRSAAGFITFLAFLVASIAEQLVAGSSGTDTFKRVAEAVGAWACGLVAIGALFMLALALS
jgi:ABC-type enterochelin transport system permease subunit